MMKNGSWFEGANKNGATGALRADVMMAEDFLTIKVIYQIVRYRAR